MKNRTKIKVPKKYHCMIELLEYEKNVGYWVFIAKGFISSDSDCRTIHEQSQNDVLKKIRTIKKL